MPCATDLTKMKKGKKGGKIAFAIMLLTLNACGQKTLQVVAEDSLVLECKKNPCKIDVHADGKHVVDLAFAGECPFKCPEPLPPEALMSIAPDTSDSIGDADAADMDCDLDIGDAGDDTGPDGGE